MKLFNRWFVFSFIFCVLIYCYGLGSLDLMDPDEARYARSSVEMIQEKDFLTPRFNGEYRWDKPVLFYWLLIGSFSVFGITEFGARFPTALFTLLTFMMVYYIASKEWTKKAGIFGILSLATSVLFLIVGRLAITDMTLCFFLSATVLSFYYVLIEKSPFFYYSGFIAAAFAVLTKGPVGIILPGIIIVITALITKRVKPLFRFHTFIGVFVFLLISLPWFIAECMVHGWEYFNYFFIKHNIQRFATEELPHVQPFYFYVPIVIGGFLPWTVLLPSGVIHWLRTARQTDADSGRKRTFGILLIVWWSVVLIFFTLSSSKLPTYILSLFVPMSFFTGRFFVNASTEKKGDRCALISFCVITTVAITATFSAIQIYLVLFREKTGIETWLLFYGLFAGLFLALFLLIKWKDWLKIPLLFVAMVSVIIVLVPQTLYTELNEYRSLKSLGTLYKKVDMNNNYPICAYVLNKPSIVFYSGQPVKIIGSLNDLESFINDNETAFCLMRENEYWVLYNEYHQLQLYVLAQQTGFILVANRYISS